MNSTKMRMIEMIGEISQEEMMEDRKINEDDEILARVIRAEADLLNAFADMIGKIRNLKYTLKPAMGISIGSDEMDSIKDIMKSKIALQAIRQKLKTIVAEKMPMLHAVIEEVLGPTEKEEESHTETHHHEEEHEEDEE